jgi:hypothetical protein
MGRKSQPNISFYHYRVDFYTEDMSHLKASKYYLTIKSIADEFNSSKSTIEKVMKEPSFKFKNKMLNNIRIYKDIQPVFNSRTLNQKIYGEVDEINEIQYDEDSSP